MKKLHYTSCVHPSCIISIRYNNIVIMYLATISLNVVFYIKYEPHHEKTNNVVFEQVQHKPSCTCTEDGCKLEISDLRRRGIVLSE